MKNTIVLTQDQEMLKMAKKSSRIVFALSLLFLAGGIISAILAVIMYFQLKNNTYPGANSGFAAVFAAIVFAAFLVIISIVAIVCLVYGIVSLVPSIMLIKSSSTSVANFYSKRKVVKFDCVLLFIGSFIVIVAAVFVFISGFGNTTTSNLVPSIIGAILLLCLAAAMIAIGVRLIKNIKKISDYLESPGYAKIQNQ